MPDDLHALARRLFWWKEPEGALAEPVRFLAQVMTLGTWEDWQVALRHWSEEDFRRALRHAPPGVIDPRSWAYWHRRLGIEPIPPLPVRHIPDAISFPLNSNLEAGNAIQ